MDEYQRDNNLNFFNNNASFPPAVPVATERSLLAEPEFSTDDMAATPTATPLAVFRRRSCLIFIRLQGH